MHEQSTERAPVGSAADGADVPFVGLSRHHDDLVEDLRAAFDRVLTRSSFILGEEVESFEEEFAGYCGVEHCVGVASGTAALALALRAAGIGAGDEVIVPAHTYIASALAVVSAGATPRFCDVRERTGLIDLASAASVVNHRTAALIAVHLYGQVCDMDAVREFAGRYGITVLEDAAQAHGAAFGDRRAGSLGDVAGFSFYPSKNLGALGDGGAVCTNDGALADRVRQLRHLGQRGKGEHVTLGENQRLDGLQAALLRAKLPHLDTGNSLRRDRAGQYREALGSSLDLLEEAPGSYSVYHLFPVRVPDRDALRAHLHREGIQTGIHYAPAVHDQPALRPFRDDDMPVAERWAREELSLPMHAELRPDEVVRVAQACREATGEDT